MQACRHEEREWRGDASATPACKPNHNALVEANHRLLQREREQQGHGASGKERNSVSLLVAPEQPIQLPVSLAPREAV